MISSFIFVLLLINVGGTFGGSVIPYNCASDTTAYLEGGTVEITPNRGSDECMGSNSCKIVARLDYTVKFTACSQSLAGTNATRIPLRIMVLIPGLFPYFHREIDLCTTHTADSVTQSCPVNLDACGTHQFELQFPVLFISPLSLPRSGVLIAQAGINEAFPYPAPTLCIQIPINFYFI